MTPSAALAACAIISRALSSPCGPTRATMTYDDTSHRIFKISELTRLIASQLVLNSRQSAVNLACACRYLEEPVLSMVWETQRSLCTLLKVLPEGTWDYECPLYGVHVVRDLDLLAEELNIRALGYLAQDLGGTIARGLE